MSQELTQEIDQTLEQSEPEDSIDTAELPKADSTPTAEDAAWPGANTPAEG